ncbi:MAG: hypothetical protein K6C97_12235 [Treponema sp.]|nr:hypothetical protein [Treponema sp.]
MKKLLVLMTAIACLLTSCATTMQQDVFQTTDLNQELMEEVSVFEDRYILIDSEYLLTGKSDASKIAAFHKSVDEQLSQSHLEPIIVAHITAIDGILYLMEGKINKAQEAYSTAKATKGGDDFVLLLGSKLEKDTESSIAKVDEILSFDPNNSILLMEKGILLYQKKEYDKAIALIDQAFIEFDNQDRNNYRVVYKEFRDKVWTLYNSGIATAKANQSLTAALTKEDMVQLTHENTSLLQDLTTGTKLSNAQLMEKVEQAGLFNSVLDPDNAQGFAITITDSTSINRVACARFLWNLYVLKKGNKKFATRYSSRYSKMANAKSPVADIVIENVDFDAVLGVVENEIMNLPDGKNFNPGKEVTVLEFLSYLKKLDS